MIALPFNAIVVMIVMFSLIFTLGYLSAVVRDIFLCGLYVYASEGVAPGAYEPESMAGAWKVKKVKKPKK